MDTRLYMWIAFPDSDFQYFWEEMCIVGLATNNTAFLLICTCVYICIFQIEVGDLWAVLKHGNRKKSCPRVLVVFTDISFVGTASWSLVCHVMENTYMHIQIAFSLPSYYGKINYCPPHVSLALLSNSSAIVEQNGWSKFWRSCLVIIEENKQMYRFLVYSKPFTYHLNCILYKV